MKKLLFLPLILLILTACGVENTEITPLPGSYVQDTEHPTRETWFPATLTLQEVGTFAFTFDLLSSYAPYGSYTQEGDVITCATADGRYTFRFQVLAGDRLAFLQEGSSPVTYFDTYFTTPVTDRMEFIRVQETE